MTEAEYYASLQNNGEQQETPVLELDLFDEDVEAFNRFFEVLNNTRKLMLSGLKDTLNSGADSYCLGGVLEREQAAGKILFRIAGQPLTVPFEMFRRITLHVLSKKKEVEKGSMAAQRWQLGQ